MGIGIEFHTTHGTTHGTGILQTGHEPPQSASTSSPFWVPSVHVAVAIPVSLVDTGCCWALMRVAGYCCVPLDAGGHCWVLAIVGCCRVLSGVVGYHWFLLGVCLMLLANTLMRGIQTMWMHQGQDGRIHSTQPPGSTFTPRDQGKGQQHRPSARIWSARICKRHNHNTIKGDKTIHFWFHGKYYSERHSK